MKIIVDSDSCPSQIRSIIVRASIKRRIPSYFVTAQKLDISKHPLIFVDLVVQAKDSADFQILQSAEENDIVITRDIPLALALLKKGIVVMSDRGEQFSLANLPTCSLARLPGDDRMNYQFKRRGAMNNKAVQKFAATFDSLLNKGRTI